VSDHGSTVREEAYRAAAAAVDSFLGRIGEDYAEQAGRVGAAARDRFRAEMGRVVDLNLDMVRNAFGMYSRLLDPENLLATSDDSLTLGPTVPGTAAATVLWMHNFDDEPIVDLGLVGSRLVAPDSGALHQPQWSFTPASVTVPARSAVPVLVGVDVPEGTGAGSYRGTVTPMGREGQPIGVSLEVVEVDPVEHDSW
jgi:hypothetical protein